MRVPCALTIGGSDSGGGAGIAADLKTFAALDVHGLCVLTAVTAQNTRGVEASTELPPEFVNKQLDAVMRDFEVEWVKTGMLGNAGVIRAVEAGVKRYGLRMVVDPVMVAATGAKLLLDDALGTLKELLSHAELTTPNVFEAERLSGLKIGSKADMRKAARAIHRLGPKAVLMKGGHARGREVVDLLFIEGKFKEFKNPRIPGGPTHGTGCTLASAITAELAKGAGFEEAVARAGEFTRKAIEFRLEVGKGVKPVNQMASLFLRSELGRALEGVWGAARLLVGDPSFAKLLPEVGSNIVMALPGAREIRDVVGLSGRIVRIGSRAQLTGFPELGGSEHVANLVLTAARYDPKIRAGLNIRFSEDILRTCEQLGLTTGEFERSEEPNGVKTMRWGTELAIKKIGKVPRVIFDRGAKGKEPMIRLLGGSPNEVAELALRVAHRMVKVHE